MCLCLAAVVHLEKSGDNMLKGFTFLKSYLLLYVLLICVCVCECAYAMLRGQHAELPLPLYSGLQKLNSGLECLQQVLGLDIGLFLPSGMKDREDMWERQWSRLSLSRRHQKRTLLQQRLPGQAAVPG